MFKQILQICPTLNSSAARYRKPAPSSKRVIYYKVLRYVPRRVNRALFISALVGRQVVVPATKVVETWGNLVQAQPYCAGLGSPKQERFMAQYCGKLDVKLMVGVGAAFDIHTGGVKEAPKWLKSLGLQWLHRLIEEPNRLWRRYLACVPSFIWNIGLQLLGIRKFSIDT